MTAAQLGARSGLAIVVVGVIYAAVLGAGMAQYGLSEPIGDPTLAAMEVLTIASAVPVLTMFVALQAMTESDRQFRATLATCCAAMFAFTTVGVHFVELTSGRAMGRHGLVWPSTTYAVELFAWDVLLGLALLLAASALPEMPSARRVRCWLRTTGGLCLVGIIGPLLGNMRLQLIGVFGYAVLLPLVAWMMMAWFREQQRPAA